jgi:hypothetical protein
MNVITKLNDKHAIFSSKEEYLKMRANWAAFINAGKAKKSFTEYHCKVTGTVYRYPVEPLPCVLHMLYIYLIGKDVSKIYQFKNHNDANRYTQYIKTILDFVACGKTPCLPDSVANSWNEIFKDVITPEVAKNILLQINGPVAVSVNYG